MLLVQQAVPQEPARRGHRGGGGQREVGVPPLPRLLRRGLHHLLQLRALPQGGEWAGGQGCRGEVGMAGSQEPCMMRHLF